MNSRPLNTQIRPTQARYYNSFTNGLLVENLKKTHQAALKCDAMGLEILNICSRDNGVVIEVANCHITRHLLKTAQAHVYKFGADHNGRYQEAKMNLEGVRICWKDYEHPVVTTRPQY